VQQVQYVVEGTSLATASRRRAFMMRSMNYAEAWREKARRRKEEGRHSD